MLVEFDIALRNAFHEGWCHGIVIVEKNGTPNFIGRDNADCSEMNVAEMQNFGLDITKGNEMNEVETQNFASLQVPLPTRRLKVNNTFGPQTKNLGSIIRGYKIGVKKYATFHAANLFSTTAKLEWIKTKTEIKIFRPHKSNHALVMSFSPVNSSSETSSFCSMAFS